MSLMSEYIRLLAIEAECDDELYLVVQARRSGIGGERARIPISRIGSDVAAVLPLVGKNVRITLDVYDPYPKQEPSQLEERKP